jgi:sulfur carrier protein
LIINGKHMEFNNGITITELLKELNLSEEKVVIEVNFEIIPREAYVDHVLNAADSIEIISFMGGG